MVSVSNGTNQRRPWRDRSLGRAARIVAGSFFDTIDMIAQLTGRDLIGPLLRETGPALHPPLAEP
jgi:hypothetical protein